METLRRLLSPEYLVVSEPGPLGRLWVLYLALGLLFAAGLGGALWALAGPGRDTRSTAVRAWAWFELWICLAGLGTVVGRFLGWPGWSARIWPYSLAALAMVGVAAYRFRHLRLPPWLAEQFRILALLPPLAETKEKGRLFLAGLLLHLAGIGLVLTARYGRPLWAAPLILLLLLMPQVPMLARRRLPRLMALTPLFGAYAATILWLLYRQLGISVVGWQGLEFPNPLTSLFYVDGIVLAAVAYALLCQIQVVAARLGRAALLGRWAVIGLLTVTLAWAGWVYFAKRTHGATATDPYAYAQMGVDLAERGTFLHRFSLFQQIPPGIAWAPLQPVGYHIPRNELGDCPSVWATGASVLLAAGYKLLGEVGLYVTTPFVALLALAATWALVQETVRGEAKTVRYLTAALTVALLATSPEHVDRLLVPMADVPAQLFTVLTLVLTLRATREGEIRDWMLGMAGVCFAWAYWVRHTQLVLALPVILVLILRVCMKTTKDTKNTKNGEAIHPFLVFLRALCGRLFRPPFRPRPHRSDQVNLQSRMSNTLLPLAVFFGAALLAALPDIVYRWRIFGGPFATETTELPLMAVQHIGPVAWQMLRDALVAGEWGYLFPLALYGGYRLFRDRRREAVVLGTAFVAVLLVNLTYRSLRLRDLIPLFPLVDLAVGYGAVALVRRVWAGVRGHTDRLGAALLPTSVVAWIIVSLALARWAMIDNLWKRGWASFGYMRAEQRAAFDRLAELTPPQAVIGASLNAGAMMLYTGRDAIRPYDSWTDEEWSTFLRAMQARGRPVYLLDDGGLMARFIEKEQSRHRLTPIAELQVPLFYTQGRESGWLYRLEWGE